MILFQTLILLLLFFQLYLIYKFHNNISSPSFYFTFTWFSIFFIYVIGSFYLPSFHFLSIVIYFVGVTFFNLGSLSIYFVFPEKSNLISHERENDKNIIIVFLIILFILLPYYFKNLLSFYKVEWSNANISIVFNQLRRASVEESTYGANFNFLNNLPLLASFIFLSTFIFLPWKKDSKVYFIIALLLNIVYNSLSGSKMSAVMSLVVVYIIYVYKTKNINFRALILGLISVFIIFSTLVYFINYTFIEFADNNDLFSEIFNTVKIYLLGGPIAFDIYVNENLYFGNNQVIYRPFIEFFRSLGFDLKIDSRHAEYVSIGSIITNVYTIYYSLYDSFGVFIPLFMFFYGVFCEIIYLFFRNGNRLFSIVYPPMIIALILSIHAENFITGLSALTKYFILYFLIFVLFKNLFSFVGLSIRRLFN
jgi:oligosaccharide repeat unit polymerase